MLKCWPRRLSGYVFELNVIVVTGSSDIFCVLLGIKYMKKKKFFSNFNTPGMDLDFKKAFSASFKQFTSIFHYPIFKEVYISTNRSQPPNTQWWVYHEKETSWKKKKIVDYKVQYLYLLMHFNEWSEKTPVHFSELFFLESM